MTESEGARVLKGKAIGYVVCWLLGLGTLVSWNSLVTVEDYFEYVFPRYHPTRVFTLVYQPFALGMLAILTYYEARVNTRLRVISGYAIYCLFVLLVPILNLATSGHGGIGPYIGTCVFVGGFGFADAFVQGGMFGDLSFMDPHFIQAFSAGLASSGVATSGLRFITKASFNSANNGLRKGFLLFFFLSAFFEILCLLLYAFVFPKLEIVKYYRSKTAAEGSKTVTADLVAGGVYDSVPAKDTEQGGPLVRRTTSQLILEKMDFCFVIVATYTLSLSIFPGFLAEDTGQHQLGTWYSITLIAMFNCGDVLGRCIPLINMKSLMLKPRPGLIVLTLLRYGLIPAFYFTAKYGTQGWMLFLCIVLGISNGYITVCSFVQAPEGYSGPEQNAIGNIMVWFLLLGIFAGVTLDWLWLIGKGW